VIFISKKPKLILIMGAPGTGKTTLAIRLAASYNIDQLVSTDILRTILRGVCDKKKNKILFTVTHEAWQLYGAKTYENIYKGFLEHCTCLYPHLKHIISKAREEGRDLIIEGAHILPFNYELLDIEGFNVYPILLQVNNDEQLLNRYDLKNNSRIVKYDGWKSNFDIIRYNEKQTLSHIKQPNKLIIINNIFNIDDILKRCMEVIK
jgi:2-phosphoglycerate kinase